MPLATCLIDQYQSGSLFTRRFATPYDAQINIDGERTVDTGTFNFDVSVDVKQGYEIKYIQDVADVTGLKLIMNFQDAGYWQYGKSLGSQALSFNVSTCANNGSGKIRVTTTATHNLITNSQVYIYDVLGTTEANGTWFITVIDGTHFDLQSSTFTHAYTSGGKILCNLKIVDESGYDMDGYCRNTTTRYGQFSGERGLKVLGVGDEVIIPDLKYFDNSSNSVGSTPVLDFSGMFDIFIRFRNDDTTNITKYLFDKSDGTTGLQIYIANGASGVVKIDAYSSGLTNITGSIPVNDGSLHMIRIMRGSDGIIRLFVDNVADGTASTSANYNNSSVPLVIGNNYFFNRPMIGSASVLSQVRVYCNVQLSDNNVNNIWTSRRQYSTMKFGGVVWQETDGTDLKTASVKSYANLLNTVLIQPSLYTNTYTSKNNQQIMLDLVIRYLTDWSIAFSTTTTTSFPIYVAQGTLLLIFQFMSISTSTTFHSEPRKILRVEDPNLTFGLTTLIPFVNGVYDITNDALDITGTTNYLEVLGMGIYTQNSETFVAGSTGVNTFTLQYNPFNVTVTDNGTAVPLSSLTVNYNAKTVAFSTTTGHTIVISYAYAQTSSGLPIYATFSDTASQTDNGFLGKRVTLNGVVDSTSINLYGNNYMTKYSPVNKRIQVNSPYPVAFARVNLAVWVTNTTKGYTNQQKTITSYTLNYPSMKTTLHLGSFLYDSYDLDNAYAVSIANTNTAIVNQNTS